MSPRSAFAGKLSFVQLGWIDRQRLVAYSAILLIASLPSFLHFYMQANGESGSDFLAFWSAGRLVLTGAAETVYDLKSTFAIQATVGRNDVFAFVNPPPFLFIVAPLGFLAYNQAWVAWICATYGFWLYQTRKADRELTWPIAAFPGALVSAWHAQTGLLTSGLQAAFATNLERRPFVAGLWTGALIIKPHLAVLMPVAFLASRNWRAIAGAACSSTILLLLAWVVFGSGTMLAYPKSWEVSRALMANSGPEFFLRQTTVYAALRATGSEYLAIWAQGMTSVVLVCLTWRVWSIEVPTDAKLAFLFAASALVTPYLFNYDLAFLILPWLWLARQSRERLFGAWKRPLLVVLYLAPLACRALTFPLGINLTFAYCILLTALIWRCIIIEKNSAKTQPDAHHR
ncbi:glycosyltransferase family 87 protein [Novosphingobium mathurense]|uniref:glycosyltransferase family 87 protein n=1 Tax=Novosphingobium mathurense TaxID=428990 RepID=UPI001591A6BB|nr:glycosyltransferase family 87 protein [Novosphingobium mathurense]